MGRYVNPGSERFIEAINSEVFVDKTKMLSYLNAIVNTNKKYVSVSRPRRFGKTMAANMICAYYDREADSRKLFEELNISKTEPVKIGKREVSWDQYLGAFDVIRVVMTDFFKKNISVNDALRNMQIRVVRDIKKMYPEEDYYDEESLLTTLNDVYISIDRKVVVVIDEWDCVFRVLKRDSEGQKEYLDFLRDLLKDNDRVALAYMTGILPIKKYGEHSALNMFDEYSIMSPKQLAQYTGFTDAEVKELCSAFGRSYEQIKEWYDGYEVSDIVPPDPMYKELKEHGTQPVATKYALYSPLSVVNAISNGQIMNYWNKTETYEALAEYIRMDFDGLKESAALLMDGGRLKVDTSKYQNDMTTFHSKDDVLSLLIHLGYLGYDSDTGEAFIPNKEILDEFKTSTDFDEWKDTFKAFELSKKLVKATWDMDEQAVAYYLEEFHDRAGNKTYNDEAALSYAVQLAYYAAQKYYTTVLELDTGKGYADIVYLPAPKCSDKPALLVELKYNKDANTAISQIKKQKYPERLEHYKGNILMVGINYDKDTTNVSEDFKRHSCKIEKA